VIVAAVGRHVKTTRTTRLMSVDEMQQALKKAAVSRMPRRVG